MKPVHKRRWQLADLILRNRHCLRDMVLKTPDIHSRDFLVLNFIIQFGKTTCVSDLYHDHLIFSYIEFEISANSTN